MKHVYFLRPISQLGPIKIGCSTTPERRLRSVEIWSPVLLEMICSAPGDHAHENTLHHRFADHRVHGEWFDPTPELLALIEEVSQTGVLPPMDVNRRVRKGVMTKRSTPQSKMRARLAHSVAAAERRAHGYGDRDWFRPDDVAAIFGRFAQFYNVEPTEDEVALIEGYIASLRALPAADRSFVAWQRWRAHQVTGQPLARMDIAA